MEFSTEYIDGIFLFSGIDASVTEELLKKHPPKLCEYRRGELVLSEEQNKNTVGFVLMGECEVRRKRPGARDVILNTLKPKMSFGILSVFSAEESYPTEIFARKNAAVLFFDGESIITMCRASPDISLNVIKFLAKKASFLNEKIAEFSAGSTEEKLSSFLLNEYERLGDGFPLNCKRCSETLGIGRASVYRSIDSLSESGYITFVDKKIYIKDPKRLERN